MLNAYLMKGGEQKKSKFYILTEPYFQKLNSNYASSLSSFMKENGLVSYSNCMLWFDLCFL
jgi:HAE1 family hydrophobic/amphiphilic exporter-1/multidrug efflux pump